MGTENVAEQTVENTEEVTENKNVENNAENNNSVNLENILGISANDTETIDKIKNFLSGNSDALANAQAELNIANAKIEALSIGIKPQFVDDAVTLASAKAKDGDVKTVLAEMRTKYASWFGDTEKKETKNENKVGKKGTGNSIGSDSKKENQQTMGQRLAVAKRSNTPKKSFWA